MGIIRLGVMFALFAGAASAFAQGEHDPERVLSLDEESFAATINDMLRRGQDGRLEPIVQSARESRARFESGVSKLEKFYDLFEAFYEDLPATSKYRYKQTLKGYIEDNPELITPRVVLVITYIADAWEARGSGWASTVTEEGWTAFYNNLESASRYANEAREIDAKDPELYNRLITIGGALDESNANMFEYAREGLEVDPGYLPIVLNMANYALPRWGGLRDDERKLAEWAVKQTEDALGEAMYFAVARYVGDVEGEAAALKLFGLEWPRIQKGFADYAKHITTDERLEQMVALYACIAGDKEAAVERLAQTDETAHDWVWSQEAMDHWRKWAAGEAEPLEYTDFHVAAQYGNVNYFDESADSVKDIHAMDPHGRRAIDYAYQKSNWPLIEYLVGRGIDVEKSERALIGIMVSAADDGRIDVVEKLIDGGLDASRSDALWYAAKEGHTEVVRLLLEKGGCAPDHVIHEKTTPLTRAANYGHIDVVKLLVSRGAEVDSKSSGGWTPFLMAIWRGKLDAAQFLLEHGADPDEMADEWNAIQLAAAGGHADTLRLALTVSGHDVNAPVEEGGFTPLHYAAHEGFVECAQALLEHPDCDVEAKDKEHGTPLVTAAGEGHYDFVRLLIEKGADVNAKDGGGRTALKLAKRNKHNDVAKLLEQHGATE